MHVSISSYSQKTPNANCMRVEIGYVTLWFSYQTIIAFYFPIVGKYVRQNEWGPTTGKHLNWIDGGDKKAKSERLTGKDFEQKLVLLGWD